MSPFVAVYEYLTCIARPNPSLANIKYFITSNHDLLAEYLINEDLLCDLARVHFQGFEVSNPNHSLGKLTVSEQSMLKLLCEPYVKEKPTVDFVRMLYKPVLVKELFKDSGVFIPATEYAPSPKRKILPIYQCCYVDTRFKKKTRRDTNYLQLE